MNPYALSQGTREITRLDIMAYLDSASNPGSKPQRFNVKNFKSSTSDKRQTFKQFLAFFVNFWPKTLFK